MSRKDENVLGLAPLSPVPSLSTDLVPFNPSRALTRDERRITEEWRKQTLVIEGTTAKTILGQTEIAELHKHGACVFDDSVSYIVGIKEEARGKEHQVYVDEFTTRQIQSLARHLLGAIEVGATNIGFEINRSLYPPPEKRGFFERLFGES